MARHTKEYRYSRAEQERMDREKAVTDQMRVELMRSWRPVITIRAGYPCESKTKN